MEAEYYQGVCIDEYSVHATYFLKVRLGATIRRLKFLVMTDPSDYRSDDVEWEDHPSFEGLDYPWVWAPRLSLTALDGSIRDLFSLPDGTEEEFNLTLSYLDKDKDIVTMTTDDDMHDLMHLVRQRNGSQVLQVTINGDATDTFQVPKVVNSQVSQVAQYEM